MDKDKWGLYGIIFAIIQIDLNLILYILTKSLTNVLLVVSLSVLVVFIMILIDNVNKIKKNEKNISNLDKRFKNIEDLNKIRLDIKELQKSVFK